jgi:hypothetical protein
VTVLLGNGSCGFRAAPGSPFAGGAVPWSVAVGDLNGDGFPDIVLVPYGPAVHQAGGIAATVLLGDGRGGFHAMLGSPLPLPGCSNPRSVAIGKLTGDEIPDFAVTCMNSAAVLLFAGQRRGGFQALSLDVPYGTPGHLPEERGIAFAHLFGASGEVMIISNGSAGTLTLVLRQ